MKPLLLYQQTDFCRFAKDRIVRKHGDRLQVEGIRTLAEARSMAGADSERPALLIWGNGRFHHFSNALNIAGSFKLVFDDHRDNVDSAGGIDYGNHNDASQKEGVVVQVCYAIVNGRPYFSVFSDGKANGILHVSTDLDFVEGFPALPHMSVGTTNFYRYMDYLRETISGDRKLRRFDMGGYSEMGRGSETVYEFYYERPLEMALAAM